MPGKKYRTSLLLGLLLLDLVDTLPLLREPVGPPLPHGLVLDSAGLLLLGEVLGSELLGLLPVDVLHQDTLVLESVTLGLKVESVVPATLSVGVPLVLRAFLHIHVLVDLAGLTVLLQQPPQNPHPSEPLDLGRHTGLGGTLSLTETSVSTGTLGGGVLPSTGTRVDDGGLNNAVNGGQHDARALVPDGKDSHVTILEELPDTGSGVGLANLGGLLGVEPDYCG